METQIGNIWDFYDMGIPIVIPTNWGWREDGKAVMGAGLAKQARHRYPDIPVRYGQWLQENSMWTDGTSWMWTDGMSWKAKYNVVSLTPDGTDVPLIMFPVKELNTNAPQLSWKNEASVTLVELSAHQLAALIVLGDFSAWGAVAMPMVGCGLGLLTHEVVEPILEKVLGDKSVILVKWTKVMK